MKKQQRCYIYTRVSTSMQVYGYSLDAQKDKLHKYADYQDMIIVKPHFIPDDFCKLFQSKSPVIKCGNDNDSKLFQS